MFQTNKTMKAIFAVAATALVTACAVSGTNSTITPPTGSFLQCESSGKNAWKTYGVEAFVAVNEGIFTKVGEELTANGSANLGTSFNGGATPEFKGNLAAFLVYLYGGPNKITYTDGQMYNGLQDMELAHKNLGITSAQYDYFVSNIIVPVLVGAGVPEADISSCFAPPLVEPTFKSLIINK